VVVAHLVSANQVAIGPKSIVQGEAAEGQNKPQLNHPTNTRCHPNPQPANVGHMRLTPHVEAKTLRFTLVLDKMKPQKHRNVSVF